MSLFSYISMPGTPLLLPSIADSTGYLTIADRWALTAVVIDLVNF